ncbi:hypothetical protein QCA50_003920 [Cerrena zonata]|uniref:Protein kinase domain-containing protein n=1 Tax=Cerrena zonata TaxID=2478898 RepID=A0AAW0GG31_9APHY
MGAIAQYITPAFHNNTPYLRDLIEALETHQAANAKCTVCNKNEAVAVHAYCCSIVCAREAFVIACQLESALLDDNDQCIVHWLGDIAQYTMNIMLAIVLNSPDTAIRQRTRRLLMMLANNNQTFPTSVFLVGNGVNTSAPTNVGGFGEVYRTIHDGMTVAAKRLKRNYGLNSMDDQKLKAKRWRCCYEALIWKTLKHERLLPLSGIIKTDLDYFMISPWHCDGASRNFLVSMLWTHERYRWGRFYQLFVYRWLLQVVQGLQHLHEQGVVHGDLHPGNVIVVNRRPKEKGHFEFDIVLTDFGLSVIREANSNQQGSTRGGAVLAPEQIRGDDSPCGRPTVQSDIFTFAALCFHLYTTRSIYPAMMAHNKNRAISALRPLDREVTVKVRAEDFLVIIPDELWEIIEKCWTVAEDRPSLNWIEEKLKGMQGSLSSVP